jgi:translation initiation factor IF-1
MQLALCDAQFAVTTIAYYSWFHIPENANALDIDRRKTVVTGRINEITGSMELQLAVTNADRISCRIRSKINRSRKRSTGAVLVIEMTNLNQLCRRNLPKSQL